MSCFVVPDFHINALVSWTIGHKVYTGGAGRAALARALAKANRRAYQERYQDPGAPSDYRGFLIVDVDHLDPLAIVKACDCLDYQASDWTGWRASDACRVLESIRAVALHLAAGDYQGSAYDLPGYSAAPWCLYGEAMA
jgi:hypothetical protein